MTENSLLCNLINTNSNWRQICEQKRIKVKEQDDLAIFNYDILADFSDLVVQEARGIIIDLKICEVVCWPFRKFGNSHEFYADEIDWETAKVQEKVDGSIIKIWFNKQLDQWQISSNSCIDADEAVLSTGYSIGELVRSTEEYQKFIQYVRTDVVNKDYTYIFELVSPKNQIVIKYDKTQLYLLGIRDNITGLERKKENFKLMNFPVPKEYVLHSLDACISAAQELNKSDYPDLEGFVVVDENWHRIKVKSPQYLIYHHVINNGMITKERAWDILQSDDFNMEEFSKMASEDNVKILEYYKEEFIKAKDYVLEKIRETLELQKAGLTRKEIALKVKDDKASYYCFKALSFEGDPEQLIKDSGNKLIKLVKDYEHSMG